MKKITSIILGIVLIAIGGIYALNAFEITNIDIFFDGWWTLFIIVPSFVGLFTQKDKTGCVISLIVGITLLLMVRDVLDVSWAWKLVLPALIVIAGVSVLVKSLKKTSSASESTDAPAQIPAQPEQESKEPDPVQPEQEESDTSEKTENDDAKKHVCAVFSGQELDFSGLPFEGGSFVAIFGGVDCDLSKAIITKDCTIEIFTLFGGVDIIVPDSVRVKVDTACVFGGVTDHAKDRTSGPTLYIKGGCIFGGVEIK
ncbi:MAG: hypothetical protein E7367_02735 [Clostridiales bacterium]|nr:hypothetical protein [Clostridiales bacterium]